MAASRVAAHGAMLVNRRHVCLNEAIYPALQINRISLLLPGFLRDNRHDCNWKREIAEAAARTDGARAGEESNKKKLPNDLRLLTERR